MATGHYSRLRNRFPHPRRKARVTFRRDNPISIIEYISKAQENARTTRDCISHEMWEDINGLFHLVSRFLPEDEIAAGLMLGVARRRGLPARYVSRYLVPSSAASPQGKQEEVIGGQASHAWTEVLIPNSGWRGFDPTLCGQVGLRHVRVAYGRNYGDVAPVRGVYQGNAGQRLAVDVRVRPDLEDEGHERLNETAAPLPSSPSALERPQQPAQQQWIKLTAIDWQPRPSSSWYVIQRRLSLHPAPHWLT